MSGDTLLLGHADTATAPPPHPTALSALLLAQDARLLSRCATHRDTPCLIVDCHGPGSAQHPTPWLVVPQEPGGSVARPAFDAAALMRKLQHLPEHWAGLPLIYGAGFDHRRELLARISCHHRLLGNEPDILALVSEPCALLDLCRHLGVPHVETTDTLPPEPDTWVARHVEDEFDWHTLPARAHPVSAPGTFFQRVRPGRSMWAAFLADGDQARLLGVGDYLPGTGSSVLGAISHAAIPVGVVARVQKAIDRLVRVCALVGLNRVQFTLADEDWAITRLTGRPTHEMVLFDDDLPHGILAAHIAAVNGGPLVAAPPPTRRGMKLVRPTTSLHISRHTAPEWCLGLPAPGRVVRRGEVLCAVLADGTTSDEVRVTLSTRAQQVIRVLQPAPRM